VNVWLVSCDKRWDTWWQKHQSTWAEASGGTAHTVQAVEEPEAALLPGPQPTEDQVEWIVEFQLWRIAIRTRFQPTLSPSEWRDFARTRYAHYRSTFERFAGPGVAVFTGSVRAHQRAGIAAARDLGLPVWVVEKPIFPRPDCTSLLLTPETASYEVTPLGRRVLEEQWGRGDAQRGKTYRSWWVRERRTKHEDRVTYLDAREIVSGRLVWFGQVEGDAAMWKPFVNRQARKAIVREALRHDAIHKPHPFGPVLPLGMRCLPREVSIHGILPYCDGVLCLSSAVGMEAFLYDQPVWCFGQPFYRSDGVLTCHTGDTSFAHEERLRFVDWVVHVWQVPTGDPARIAERIGAEWD